MLSPLIGLNEENANKIISACNEQEKKLVILVGESGQFKTTLVELYINKTLKKQKKTDEIAFYICDDLIICDTPGFDRENKDFQSLIPISSSILIVTCYYLRFYKNKIVELAKNLSSYVAEIGKNFNIEIKPALYILVWITEYNDMEEIPYLSKETNDLIDGFNDHNFLSIGKFILSPLPSKIIRKMQSQKEKFCVQNPCESSMNEISKIFDEVSKSPTNFINTEVLKNIFINQAKELSILEYTKVIYSNASLAIRKNLTLQQLLNELEECDKNYKIKLHSIAENNEDFENLLRYTDYKRIELENDLKFQFNKQTFSRMHVKFSDISQEFESFICSKENEINDKTYKEKKENKLDIGIKKTVANSQNVHSSSKNEYSYEKEAKLKYNENNSENESIEEKKQLNFLIQCLQTAESEFKKGKAKFSEIELIETLNYKDYCLKVNELIEENLNKMKEIYIQFCIIATDELLLKGIRNKYMNSIESELSGIFEHSQYIMHLDSYLLNFTNNSSGRLIKINDSFNLMIDIKKIMAHQEDKLKKCINDLFYSKYYSKIENLKSEIEELKLKFNKKTLEMHVKFQDSFWKFNLSKEFKLLKNNFISCVKKEASNNYQTHFEEDIMILIKQKEDQVNKVLNNHRELTKNRYIKCKKNNCCFLYNEKLESYWEKKEIKCKICNNIIIMDFQPSNDDYEEITQEQYEEYCKNKKSSSFGNRFVSFFIKSESSNNESYHRHTGNSEKTYNNHDLQTNELYINYDKVEKFTKSYISTLVEVLRSPIKLGSNINTENYFKLKMHTENLLDSLINEYKFEFSKIILQSTNNSKSENYYVKKFSLEIDPLLNVLQINNLSMLIKIVEERKIILEKNLMNTRKLINECEESIKIALEDFRKMVEKNPKNKDTIKEFSILVEKYNKTFASKYEMIFFNLKNKFCESILEFYQKLHDKFLENGLKNKGSITCNQCKAICKNEKKEIKCNKCKQPINKNFKVLLPEDIQRLLEELKNQIINEKMKFEE